MMIPAPFLETEMKYFTVDKDPGVKVVRLNLFTVNNERVVRQVIRAGTGKLFTADHIQELVDRAVERIDEHLPGHEYEIIQVSRGVFNFVWKSGPVTHPIATTPQIPANPTPAATPNASQ